MSNEPWHEPLEPSYSEEWGDESTSESEALDDIADDNGLFDSMDTSTAEAIEDYDNLEDELDEEPLMLDFDYSSIDGFFDDEDEYEDDY